MYASETGNCEQISDDLLKSLRKQYSNSNPAFQQMKRSTMNQYNQLGLQQKDTLKVVVFITSSTGDGESPDNGLKFQSYLRKESSSRALSHVSYTILGLGDSNYSKFQGAPRFLDQRMQELGAHKFYARGEADDATSLAKVVEPWLKGLPEQLMIELDRLQNLDSSQIQELKSEGQLFTDGDELMQDQKEDQSTTTYMAKLIDRKLICQEEDRLVFEVKVELGRSVTRDRLDVGQSVAVFPKNKASDVNKIIQLFGWNKDQLIGNYTIEQLLLNEIDISKRKLNLSNLTQHFLMCSADFDSDLERLVGIDSNRFTLLELATQCEPFTSERFLLNETVIEDGLLKIQPRYFSILNDAYTLGENTLTQECKQLTFCFNLHKFKDHFSNIQNGLCTNYLAHAELGTELKFQISKNTRVLSLPSLPLSGEPLKLLIICMGTGVVPFISILQRIQHLKQNIVVQMFYGVRNSKDSFYYAEFLQQFFQQQNQESHLYVSCSREEVTNRGASKNMTFVQGRLQEPLSKFCLQSFKLIQENGRLNGTPDVNSYILICGNKNALQTSVFSSLHIDDATKTLLRESGRLMMELWNE